MRIKKNKYSINSDVVEIEITGWAKMVDNKINNLKKDITNIKKSIWKEILELKSTNINKDRSLLDFNMKTAGLKNSGKTYVKCSIFLHKCNSNIDLKNIIDKFIDSCINNIFTKNEKFVFSKDKFK